MGKPKTPSVPGLSPQEIDLLNKQGVTLDQLNEILAGETAFAKQNQGLLQNLSGLYGADGQLDTNAVANLRNTITAQQTMQRDIETKSAERYAAALKGELAPGDALVNIEGEEFKKLKEAAGRRGIKVEGDDIFTATSDSTSGNQLVARLRSEASGRRDAERNAIISQGFMGFGTPEINYLNAATEIGPSRLTSPMLGLGQGYSSAAQPYQDQRMLQFQGNLQGNANKSSFYGGIGSLLGGAAGAVAGNMILPGYGALLGFGLGSGVGRGVGGTF